MTDKFFNGEPSLVVVLLHASHKLFILLNHDGVRSLRFGNSLMQKTALRRLIKYEAFIVNFHDGVLTKYNSNKS